MLTASFSRVLLGRRTSTGAAMRPLGLLLALLAVVGTRTSAESMSIVWSTLIVIHDVLAARSHRIKHLL